MTTTLRNLTEKGFDIVFAPSIRKNIESGILLLAGIGFLIHLALVFLKANGLLETKLFQGSLLNDPISAIYTPFSLILIYEVYLLLFYLPRSFTSCVVKQFEIISLIVIRKIFKDIPSINLDTNWYLSEQNLQLLTDLVGFLLLFLLIYLFNSGKKRLPVKKIAPNLERFINSKKMVSLSLLVVLSIMSFYSLGLWSSDLFTGIPTFNSKNIDGLFFNQFFTILILADVVILLISFRYTEEYSKLIRNTGFIIATILLRLSFSATDYLNMLLILTAVSFALLILSIYNAMENPILPASTVSQEGYSSVTSQSSSDQHHQEQE